MIKNKTGRACSFTGHRPHRLPGGKDESDPRCQKLKDALAAEIVRMIQEEGVTHFLSGMAMGVDIYAAEAVLDVRKRFPQITLECALPCEDQAAHRSAEEQKRYQSILEQADVVTLVQREHTRDCMDLRNRYLAEHADALIAVWDGQPGGGTVRTIEYARDRGIEPFFIMT